RPAARHLHALALDSEGRPGTTQVGVRSNGETCGSAKRSHERRHHEIGQADARAVERRAGYRVVLNGGDDMKIRAMGLCVICIALRLAGAMGMRQSPAGQSVQNQTEGAGSSGLTVHEWGTFTSVAGKDGAAIEWRPLDGSRDLPNFVFVTENLRDAAGGGSGGRCVKVQ